MNCWIHWKRYKKYSVFGGRVRSFVSHLQFQTSNFRNMVAIIIFFLLAFNLLSLNWIEILHEFEIYGSSKHISLILYANLFIEFNEKFLHKRNPIKYSSSSSNLLFGHSWNQNTFICFNNKRESFLIYWANYVS